MLGNLGENLTNTMKKLAGMSVIDKKVVKEIVHLIFRIMPGHCMIICRKMNSSLIGNLCGLLTSHSTRQLMRKPYS